MDVHVRRDRYDTMNFTSLTPQQVRDYHKLSMPFLPMEKFTKSMCPEIEQTIVIIPNWDNKGNQQMYVKQVDGTWIDCYNECYVTNEFVIARIIEREMKNGYINQLARNCQETR